MDKKKIVKNLLVKIFLLENIEEERIKTELSYLIDKTLNKTQKYKSFHNDKGVKFYSFSKLRPFEQDCIYKKDNIYTFNIRTVNEDLSKYLLEELRNEFSENIKVLTITETNLNKNFIEKIYSLTPTVLTFFDENKEKIYYWESEKTLLDVLNRIQESLILKYNSFYNTDIALDTPIFTRINRKNTFPIPQKYKNIRMSTDMFELEVESTVQAQEIAYFACGIGIGGKTSRGFGFVNPKRMTVVKRG